MSELCLGCMKELHGEVVCPFCDFPQNAVQASPFLPLGTLLKNRFIVGKVIDTRADSARYIGYDNSTKKAVTIREFMPRGLFTRLEDSTVVVVSDDSKVAFNSLKEKFVSLAQRLFAFHDCAAIVPVVDIFEDNNTSYVVSESNEFIPFAEYIKRSGGSLEWDTARPMFMPLLSALSKINNRGLFHFAVCPANLVVTPAGKIRMINFAISNIRQTGGILPPQLSVCSAPEQYEAGAIMDEATDVYGFTATLFYALTGNLPADAVKRKEDSRLLMSTNVVKRLPPHVVSALANGLQIVKNNRIADFETLRAQLSAAPTVQAIQEEIAKPAVPPPIHEEKEDKRKVSNFMWGVIAMAISLAVFGIGSYFYLQHNDNPLDWVFTQGTKPTTVEDASNPADLPENYTYPADSKYFRIPNFMGKTFEQAKKEAENSTEYYVYLALDQEFSDTVPDGQICRQTPDAQKTVERGNDGVSITLTVSKGQQYRELPAIAGLTKEAVAETLEKQGFVVNSTLDYSTTVADGYVISYAGNVKAGDKIEYGSTVAVTISLGAKPQSQADSVFKYDETASAAAAPVSPATSAP